MITQTQFEQIKNSSAVTLYEAKMTEYKAFLQANKLSFKVDFQALVLDFKTGLFLELMKVDKGLAYEFTNMLRTDDAKIRKIESKVDLSGYTVIGDLEHYIRELNHMHKQVFPSSGFNGAISIAELVTEFDGIASKYIETLIISWDGLEEFKVLFDKLEDSVNDLLPVFAKMHFDVKSSNKEHFMRLLSNALESNFDNEVFQGVRVNDVYVVSKLKN